MELKVVELNEVQCEDIEQRLNKYDEQHIKFKLSGSVSLGAMDGEKLIAGVDGCMTAFRIFYVSTVFVDESYRGNGVGKLLMKNIENKAKELGANMIRLDTFDWQGAEFYRKLGYDQVGEYTSETDNFSEYFFLKRL